ncbi:MAG: hypothetical protein KAR20_20865 [Candidatus Heimdallarchaeota archaeon]|nr:hypothetical protein [Candidatus Heimdallarchaeota archaeon]
MNYSPILSLITALFEISVAIWALLGTGRKKIIYSVVAILILLAIYQILEVIICSNPNSYIFLSRLAFMVIIWLPSICVLLIAHLYPTKKLIIHWYSRFLFILSLMIIIWIFFKKEFVSETVCSVIFAHYSNPMPAYLIYAGLYQLGLFSILFLSASGVIVCRDHNQRLLLGQILLGSMAFVIPAMITVITISSTTGALPSVMCHYALLFALFLTRLIYLERKLNRESSLDS